ncbi:hypothetical protein Tco_1096719, partial [Tanacetum coccineum]
GGGDGGGVGDDGGDGLRLWLPDGEGRRRVEESEVSGWLDRLTRSILEVAGKIPPEKFSGGGAVAAAVAGGGGRPPVAKVSKSHCNFTPKVLPLIASLVLAFASPSTQFVIGTWLLTMSVLIDACSLALDPHAFTLALEDASDACALANIHALAFSMSF